MRRRPAPFDTREPRDGALLANAPGMDTVTRRWWMLDVRGMASFGLAAFLLLGPSWDSSQVLAIAFGIYAVVDAAGTLAFVRGARGFETAAYIGRGVLGLAAGILVLAHPTAAIGALYLVVSTWAIGAGALEIVFGSRTWTTVPRPVAFMVEGMLSFGLGATAIHFPLENTAMLRGFLAAYAVANGIAATLLGESLHALPARRAT